MTKLNTSLDDLETRVRVQLGVGPSAHAKPPGSPPRARHPAPPARRRFASDGEVPTVLTAGSQGAQMIPTRLRLEEALRGLAAETTRRQELERRLEDAATKIQSLQTQNGSLQISRDEALMAARAVAPPAAATVPPATTAPAHRRSRPHPTQNTAKTKAPDNQVPVKWWIDG